jgi:hypothetical protein
MLIPGMPRAGASSVYKEVEIALACQPGEAEPAINGDGHGIVKDTFFAGKVPPTWLRQINLSLVHVHESAEGIEVRRAVSLDSFHSWVARKVRAVDNQYIPGNTFIGRSRNAREIHQSLSAWAISQSQRRRSPRARLVTVAATAATAALPKAHMDAHHTGGVLYGPLRRCWLTEEAQNARKRTRSA